MAKKYIAPKHNTGKVLTTKTAFGSTSDMIVQCEDPSIQNIVLEQNEVICKDDYGLYITNTNRIDSGLADPNRYANPLARSKFLKAVDTNKTIE